LLKLEPTPCAGILRKLERLLQYGKGKSKVKLQYAQSAESQRETGNFATTAALHCLWLCARDVEQKTHKVFDSATTVETL